MTEQELEEIFKLTKNNAVFLENEENEDARLIGCIGCDEIFTIEEGRIFDNEYCYLTIDDGDTVTCPFCGGDSLIFEDAGVKVTPELLNKLRIRYQHLLRFPDTGHVIR